MFLTRPIASEVLDLFPQQMSRLLPPDLRIKHICAVSADFSVRLHPLWREYHYRLAWGTVEDPLQRRHCAFHFGQLNAQAMAEAVCAFEGTHDFQAFSNARSDMSSTVREITQARFVRVADREARFEV